MSQELYIRGRTTGLSTGSRIIMLNPSADPFPANPNQLSLVSTSDEDQLGGDGIAAVRIHGVCENDGIYSDFVADSTVTGLTPIDVVVPEAACRTFRINHARVLPTDFTGDLTNIGTINLRIGGTIAAQIAPGRGATEMAIFSNSSDTTARLKEWWASIRTNTGIVGQAQVDLYFSEFGGPWFIRDSVYLTNSIATPPLPNKGPGVPIERNTDVMVQITRITGTMDAIARITVRRTVQVHEQF